MSGRKFHLSLYGARSDDHTLNYGVPHGSVIGPKAFTMYAESVTAIIQHYTDYGIIYMPMTFNYSTYLILVSGGEAAAAVFKF